MKFQSCMRSGQTVAVIVWTLLFLGAAGWMFWSPSPGTLADEALVSAAEGDASARVLRDHLRQAVEWLALPEREGRGPGTSGIDQAADWVGKQFQSIGLETRVEGVGPFQPFTMTLEAKLGPAESNTAELVGPLKADGSPKIVSLKLGTDFTPLAAGGSGPFDVPLVFAGYGITSPTEKYDDYAPLTSAEAAGGTPKAGAIVLRQEPQKDDPHSVFSGNQASEHAALSRKVANASEHEMAAVIFCNDANSEPPSDPTDAHKASGGDELMAFTRAGDGSERRSMPILQVRRSILESVVEASLSRDLAAIQKTIDESLLPQSSLLPGWRIRGNVAIERVETQSKNVLAILPGNQSKPSETVVLGAHYDHLGFGGANSAAPGEHVVHHGADDNASGTAMLVEVARILKAEGPFPRTVLFIAFSGEERGLLGSAHYTANAAVPLADTVAMVNLDMVGRLEGQKLIVHGTGTGSGFEALVDRLIGAHSFEVAKEPGGFGPSDHSSFYAKKIPVLHIFTGSHSDYHRPTDTADKINYDGMVRITQFVASVVRELATAPLRPEYIEVASKQFAGGGGDRPYFGSIPDFGKPGNGYAITGATKDSPAALGGLLAGDVIVRLGKSAVTGLEDFDSALRKYKAGETVVVVVVRSGVEVALPVVLGPPK